MTNPSPSGIRRALDTLACPDTQLDTRRIDDVIAVLRTCEAYAASLTWQSDTVTVILDRCNAVRARWGL